MFSDRRLPRKRRCAPRSGARLLEALFRGDADPRSDVPSDPRIAKAPPSTAVHCRCRLRP